ncbi:hypothetical protein JL721_6389 [Aureococcus anophagefferens]|nr:hypothetical protein JL721_6389 [Aureococcus anophagefferens]
MMTFLPLEDFLQSALSLDDKRLQNQRTEARFVLEWLEGRGFELEAYGAARMWRGYRDALAAYYNACLEAYEARGKTNGPTMPRAAVPTRWERPPWLGDGRFHASHRAQLLEKNRAYYERHGWREATEAPELGTREYMYPVPMDDGRWGLYPQSKYKKRTVVAVCHGEILAPAPPRRTREAEDAEPAAAPRRKRKAEDAEPAEPPARPRRPRKAKADDAAAAPAAREPRPTSGARRRRLDRKKGSAISQIDADALRRAVGFGKRMEAEGLGAVQVLDNVSLRLRGKEPKRVMG